MLPINVQEKILKDWYKQINVLEKIRFKVLKDGRERRGLVILNNKLYYQAGGLVWIAVDQKPK